MLLTTGSGSVGLGAVILAVGLLMAAGAAMSLRSIWGRRHQTEQDEAADERNRLRAAGVGPVKGWLRLVVSFDFGCLALLAAALIFLGLVLLFRASGA